MDLQIISDVTFLGCVLLSKTASPYLEAFSENALYCCWGRLVMDKYKTVKEVCQLTGLTRKHLYYFHHAKVVQAAAFSNYSVEGNDGYNLYDNLAVKKLQQIALFYQLGWAVFCVFSSKKASLRQVKPGSPPKIPPFGELFVPSPVRMTAAVVIRIPFCLFCFRKFPGKAILGGVEDAAAYSGIVLFIYFGTLFIASLCYNCHIP